MEILLAEVEVGISNNAFFKTDFEEAEKDTEEKDNEEAEEEMKDDTQENEKKTSSRILQK